MSAEQSHVLGEHPDMPPPVTEVGVIGWVRHNLFSSTTNIVITVLTLYFLYLIVPSIMNWAPAGPLSANVSNCSFTGFIRMKNAGGSTFPLS